MAVTSTSYRCRDLGDDEDLQPSRRPLYSFHPSQALCTFSLVATHIVSRPHGSSLVCSGSGLSTFSCLSLLELKTSKAASRPPPLVHGQQSAKEFSAPSVVLLSWLLPCPSELLDSESARGLSRPSLICSRVTKFRLFYGEIAC